MLSSFATVGWGCKIVILHSLCRRCVLALGILLLELVQVVLRPLRIIQFPVSLRRVMESLVAAFGSGMRMKKVLEAQNRSVAAMHSIAELSQRPVSSMSSFRVRALRCAYASFARGLVGYRFFTKVNRFTAFRVMVTVDRESLLFVAFA